MKKMIILLALCIIFMCNVTFATNSYELDILVIEINPVLQTKGNIRASQYVGMKEYPQMVVNELLEDLEESSHGLVKGNIVKKEYLEEFPTYTKELTLMNNEKSYRLDEQTWIDIMSVDGKAQWYGWWERNKYCGSNNFIDFNYDYLIEKFDLIDRRNNNEFDMVWLVTIDPSNAFETMMVGRTAYWVNGTPYIADCDNFIIFNPSISRPDCNFECIGHMAENIMTAVFGKRFNDYSPNQYNVTDLADLNLWERFILNNYSTPSYSGVGNMHFAPNSVEDYDWDNKNYVYSSWIDWKNYPNLTGKTVLTNCDTWWKEPKNGKYYSYNCRQHHVWWFSLFPHISGRTNDGYSNNWWDYIATLDYVVKVESKNNKIIAKKGENINNAIFTLTYQSGKKENVALDNSMNNIYIQDSNIVDSSLKAINVGQTYIGLYYDGKYAKCKVEIEEEIDYNLFSDVSKNHWAYGVITSLTQTGIINGYVDNTFKPQNNVTRAEAVKMLMVALKSKDISNVQVNSTTDVNISDWCNQYILNGKLYIQSYMNDEFLPNKYITRAEFVNGIANAIGGIGSKAKYETDFKDIVDLSDDTINNIAFLTKIGIINGYDDNTFRPYNQLTRAEAAKVIYTAIEYAKNNVIKQVSGWHRLDGKYATIEPVTVMDNNEIKVSTSIIEGKSYYYYNGKYVTFFKKNTDMIEIRSVTTLEDNKKWIFILCNDSSIRLENVEEEWTLTNVINNRYQKFNTQYITLNVAQETLQYLMADEDYRVSFYEDNGNTYMKCIKDIANISISSIQQIENVNNIKYISIQTLKDDLKSIVLYMDTNNRKNENDKIENIIYNSDIKIYKNTVKRFFEDYWNEIMDNGKTLKENNSKQYNIAKENTLNELNNNSNNIRIDTYGNIYVLYNIYKENQIPYQVWLYVCKIHTIQK